MAIMLEPFIPFSCEKIWCQLGMNDCIHQQSWPSVSEIRIPAGHLLGKVEPIFTKIDLEVIGQQKEVLGMHNG
jgi:methionyl-tRNA synthetase